jgi:hypothetical protein
MSIREGYTTYDYSEIVDNAPFNCLSRCLCNFGANNTRFYCVPSGFIGNAQQRDAGIVAS